MNEKKMWKRGFYEHPMKNILRTAKSLPSWDLNKIYCLGL
jgi:hypothetical protein